MIRYLPWYAYVLAGCGIGITVLWDVVLNLQGTESVNNGWRELDRTLRIE